MVRARIQPKLKREAEGVFRKVGLSPSEAVNVFYRQVVLRNGIPFNVALPNEETKSAIQSARSRKGVKKFRSVEALFDELES